MQFTLYRFCEESQKQKHAMLNMARQVWNLTSCIVVTICSTISTSFATAAYPWMT